MYYILIPKEVIEKRNVFSDYPKLPGGDGRTILPVGDLRFTQFSYGQVELINQENLDTLIVSLRSKDSASSTNTEKGGTK